MFSGKVWRVIFALAALLAMDQASAQRPHRQHRAAATQRGPHPAMWLLEDGDTKIYLFGTYHILPPGFRWRSPRFDSIARGADELVIEIADFDAAQSRSEAMAELRLGKHAPIMWRVSPDRRQALQDMVDDLGVPIERFDDMQTWAVAMGLVAVQIVRAMSPPPRGGNGDRPRGAGQPAVPIAPANSDENQAAPATPAPVAQVAGVEGPLVAEFRATHRPISGVETAAQQMRFFRVLTFAEQRALLEAIVDGYTSGRGGGLGGDGDIGENEWAQGNVRAMAAAAEDLRGPLYDALLRRRNAAWTDWLIHRLERPGTLLFAVGAAHFAGADSVRAMLAARGFRVRRVQ